MWQQVLPYLMEWAPLARETAFLLVICAFFALQIAKLRLRILNLALGSGFFLIALAYGAAITALHANGLTAEISAVQSSTGILVQYGIVWPLLIGLFGVTIACIGYGKKNADERKT